MPARHDLFVSYDSRDRAAVQVVQQLLRARNVSAFVDRESLVPGLPWCDALEDALGKARAVAVFIGAYELGAWQKREIAFALDRQAKEENAGRRFPVVPVLISQTDLDNAPGFLLLNTWIDLRGTPHDADALDALVRTVRDEASSLPRSPLLALCPYRALRAFREEDAPLFFGREDCANELCGKVLTNPVVAVVGASGSGKSSVVQAGLLPLLRRQRPPRPSYDVLTITPGKRPFHALAAALVPLWARDTSQTDTLLAVEKLGNGLANGEASLDGAVSLALKESPGIDRLLVIVDQFEELFTLTPDADRGRFVKALLECAEPSRVTILLTLRADFYGRAIGLSRDLSDKVQLGLVNVGPMTREELRRAIENPARNVGLEFESGLLDRVLDHVEHQPGNLPLLEFALTELWEKRKAGVLLNHQGYDDIGGVEGAISRRAEEQYSRLSPQEQGAASRMLTRLVRVADATEEGTDTRQRVSLNQLDATARSVIQSFVAARLLVTGRDEITNEQTAEVAHEALIRTWDRLKESLNDDREFLLWRQRFGLKVSEWQRTGRDAGSLLRGALLAEAKRHVKPRTKDLNELEHEFITSSEAAAARPRRWATAAAVVALLVASGFVAQAAWTRSDAYQVRAVVSESRGLIAFSGASVPDWLHTLVLVGRSREALEQVQRIANLYERGLALAGVAQALVKTGKPHDAIVSARQIHEARLRSRALAAVLVTMAQTGGSTAVLHAAETVEDAYSLSAALASVADTLIQESRNEDARPVASKALEMSQRIDNPYSRNEALDRAVVVLARAGATAEALDAVRKLVDAKNQSWMLAQVIAARATTRRSDEAWIVAVDYSIVRRAQTLAGSGDTMAAFELVLSHYPRELASVISGVLQAGRTDDVTSISNELIEAVRRVNAAHDHSAALVRGAEALAEEGRGREALDSALKIGDDGYRSAAMVRVVAALAETGQSKQALEVALRIEHRWFRGHAFIALLEAAAKTPKSDQAKAIAKLVEPVPFEDQGLTLRLALALAQIHGSADALRVLSHPRVTRERAPMLARAVDALSKTANIEELLGAARKIPDISSRTVALVRLGEILATSGDRTRGRSVVDEAQQTARQFLRDLERSVAIAKVAQGFAKLHLYRLARETIRQDTFSPEKLAVHTAIVREYYIERNPSLAELFEGR